MMMIFSFRPFTAAGIAFMVLGLTSMPPSSAASDSAGLARYEAIARPLCPAFNRKLERMTSLDSRQASGNRTTRDLRDAFAVSEIYLSDAVERCSLSATGDTRIALLLVADHFVTDAINLSDMPVAERMQAHRAARAFFSSKGVPRCWSREMNRSLPSCRSDNPPLATS